MIRAPPACRWGSCFITSALGLNNRGQVVGEFIGAADRLNHGFLWQHGDFTTIDVPGAAATSVVDVNDRGQILGLYSEDELFGTSHGFLLDDGVYTTFDVPGAALTVPSVSTTRARSSALR